MILEKEQTRKTPFQTIHAQCHYFVQSRLDSEVENCTGHFVFATGKPCPFYECRMGNKKPSVKIMRKYCLDCMGKSKQGVNECPTSDCLIHPFRFGKNLALARKGKSPDEMVRISALRRPLVKGNPVYFERSDNRVR